MNKRKDALEKLVEFADSVVGHEFKWGRTDCIALGCDAVAAMTGEFDSFQYCWWEDKDGALIASKQMTVRDVLIDMGFRQIDIKQAGSGDVVTGWLKNKMLPYCYIGVGSLWLSSTPADGVYLSRRHILEKLPEPTAWRLD
ncbi:MAG: hypothetical protein KDI07_05245 [Anaerolineae bacterium]|nr:hypothetical protein [Anaerolineae bacterium]